MSWSIPSPVAHETRNTPAIARRRCRTARFGEQVGLVQNDDLGPLVEAGAIPRELLVDHPEALIGVALGAVDHVQQQPCALEVGQKLVPETDALAGALDQARDIRDRELPASGPSTMPSTGASVVNG